MKKIIRIVAKCDLFSVDETVEESKSFSRLKGLRELFLSYPPYKRGTLQVTTLVVNPTLFN